MSFVRFSSLSNVAESGNSSTGWIYTRTGSGDFTVTYAGSADQNFGSLDCEVIYVYATGIPHGGLDTNNTANASNNWRVGCYANSLGTAYVFLVDGVFNTAADASFNAATGDWIRYQRRGSTLTVYASNNSGSSWTLIKTLTSWSTGAVYPKLNFNGAASIGPVYFAAGVTYSAAAESISGAVQNPAALSIQPVTVGSVVAVAEAIQTPSVTFPVTVGSALAVAAAVQTPVGNPIQPVAMGGAVQVAAAVQTPSAAVLALPTSGAIAEAVQQPAAASTQPVIMGGAIQLALAVQQPAVTQNYIVVSTPGSISLAVQSPSVLDPYPHDFPRRSRHERRRATRS